MPPSRATSSPCGAWGTSLKAEAAGGHRAPSAGRARRAGGRRLGAYLFGILAASALTVALAVAVLRPPLNDVLFLALLFAITGGGSALIGLVSHRLGW